MLKNEQSSNLSLLWKIESKGDQNEYLGIALVI